MPLQLPPLTAAALQHVYALQVKDKSGQEDDDLDEAICPTDMNLICDDDLRKVLGPLDPKVKLTVICDCCHSGGMLDHPKQQIAGDKDPDAPEGVDNMDARELMGSFFKGSNVRAFSQSCLARDFICAKLMRAECQTCLPGARPGLHTRCVALCQLCLRSAAMALQSSCAAAGRCALFQPSLRLSFHIQLS